MFLYALTFNKPVKKLFELTLLFGIMIMLLVCESILEYRFLLEQNSNIFTFLDVGWHEQKLTDSYKNDIPYGIGIGILSCVWCWHWR